jgi:hypothetical protein
LTPGADVPNYRASFVFQSKDPADVFSFVRRLAKWRKGQVKLLPHIAKHVLKASEEDLETVPFFLPSDLSPGEIEKHNLQKLLEEEISLREAVLNEWLEKIREATIHVDAAYGAKGQNARGQYENLRSNDGIKKLVVKRNQLVAEYHGVRRKLQHLNHELALVYPELKASDFKRVSTIDGRSVGASQAVEGAAFRANIGAGPSTTEHRNRPKESEGKKGKGTKCMSHIVMILY